MNEPKTKERTFKVITVLSLVLLAGAVIWLGYRIENLPTQTVEKPTTNETEEETADSTQYMEWDTTVNAGGGAFAITFPDGWGPLIKTRDGSALVIGGTRQPEVAAGKDVVITEVESRGSDSLSLFSVITSPAGGFAPPRGEASEFIVGKGEDALVGKKYIYTYDKDDIVGIGHLRLQGDRDYEYVFTIGGKEVHVFYSVYGSDPRNQINIVDQIVHTIRPPS